MKILLVHKFFHVTGGAEVFFFETGRILKENGHDVAYFSTTHDQNLPSEYSSYFVCPPQYRSKNVWKRLIGIVDIIYSVKAKRQFQKLLSDFNPDIVHIFAMFTHISPSILEACSSAHIPVVLSCNDYKHICPNYKLYHHGRLCTECKTGEFYHAVLNRCCQNSLAFSVASSLEAYVHEVTNIVRKHVHTFTFAGEFMVRVTEEFWGKDAFRWRKLLNPFNSMTCSSSVEYADYFVFFGRFVEEKGCDILLSAMANVPEAKLIIIGDGPLDSCLRKMSKDLGLLNVEFVGPKWGEALSTLLMKARFVVVPSVWHENFPYVILQAFAAAKPVIGSDRGGIPELIQDGEFGYVYPANDPNALADRIHMLWNNPSLAVKMGVKAKYFVDTQFTDHNFYQNLMSIYKEVLS